MNEIRRISACCCRVKEVVQEFLFEVGTDALESLYEQHPDIRTQLESSEGQLHRFVNLYLNDEDVRMLGWLDTPVSESDTLTILPAMAGGAGGPR